MRADGETVGDEIWAYAQLTIKSSTISSDDMCRVIPIPPTRTWNKGESNQIFAEDSIFSLRNNSGVQYRSRLPPSESGERHLDDLLQLVREHEASIKALLSMSETEALVSISSSSAYPQQSIFVASDDLQLLGRLDVPLWIVCYSIEEPERGVV